MTLGKKIRTVRKKAKMTQQELCRNHLTRNMLSAIECDKASPSLATLIYIAERLSVSPEFLISDDEDMLFYEKKQAIKKIRNAYSEKKYDACILLVSKLSSVDDELAFLLCDCHFRLGRQAVLRGALITAKKHFTEAHRYSELTVYDTTNIKHLLDLYNALANNIQSPLLEFDPKKFDAENDPDFDYEFYRYIISDSAHNYKNPIFSKHMLAKNYMKERKYVEALKLLNDLIDEKDPNTYNSYVMFGVYTDMEYCSKQLANFEAAYKYASKRLSMIEGFKA